VWLSLFYISLFLVVLYRPMYKLAYLSFVLKVRLWYRPYMLLQINYKIKINVDASL